MNDKQFLVALKETFNYKLVAYKSPTKQYRSKEDLTSKDFLTWRDLSELHEGK